EPFSAAVAATQEPVRHCSSPLQGLPSSHSSLPPQEGTWPESAESTVSVVVAASSSSSVMGDEVVVLVSASLPSTLASKFGTLTLVPPSLVRSVPGTPASAAGESDSTSRKVRSGVVQDNNATGSR